VLADAFKTTAKSTLVFPEISAGVKVQPIEMLEVEQDFVSDH
jgi:hypothetical protein